MSYTCSIDRTGRQLDHSKIRAGRESVDQNSRCAPNCSWRSLDDSEEEEVKAPKGRLLSPSAATVAASWNKRGVMPFEAAPTRNARSVMELILMPWRAG